MSTPLLETRNLLIQFGGVIAANDVSLKIEAGRNLAIIGPNGAGKTTFLNICTGWIKPKRGQVLFDGEDVTPLPPLSDASFIASLMSVWRMKIHPMRAYAPSCTQHSAATSKAPAPFARRRSQNNAR